MTQATANARVFQAFDSACVSSILREGGLTPTKRSASAATTRAAISRVASSKSFQTSQTMCEKILDQDASCHPPPQCWPLVQTWGPEKWVNPQ